MTHDNKTPKLSKEDFSVEKVGDLYQAYAHFAPFYYGNEQKGRHRVIRATAESKNEALNILTRQIIKDLEELL